MTGTSNDFPAPRAPSARLTTAASGLALLFAAFGSAAWLCGASTWAAFYLGARGERLVDVSTMSTVTGFASAIVAGLLWYGRRAARGDTAVPIRAVALGSLALPAGALCWAVFVDATAWHHGRDVVRPAFDHVVMYLVLGGVLPIGAGVPWLVSRMERRHPAGR